MELRALRAERELSQERVAYHTGLTRMDVSKLENGQSADQAQVLNILEAFGVTGEQWTALATIAQQAAAPGWWDSVKHIGERQALYANLEAGAVTIRKYEQTFLPGLLQIPEWVQARALADGSLEPVSGTVEGIIAGRAGRRRNLRRPGGPTLEVIIDEVAVRRRAVPPAVLKKQLLHLLDVMASDPPAITLRVLPVDAEIPTYAVPRCTFSIYSYPDPGDPKVVAVDTVTSDVIVTDEPQVTPYEKLYDRLRDAALSPADTTKLLTEAAAALPGSDAQYGPLDETLVAKYAQLL
jgi:transcriptional regulator with XRE-family HTH domain